MTDKISEALEALERLTNDALASRDGYGDAHKDSEIIFNILSKLEAVDGAALDEALEFYSNESNYSKQLVPEECGRCYYWSDPKIEEDKGQRARDALKAARLLADIKKGNV